VYITPEGRKVHPRSAKQLLQENVEWKLKNDPAYFEGKKGIRIYWLTSDFLEHKGIIKLQGKQFRYIYPITKLDRKYLKQSTVQWSLNYPKEPDIIWKNGQEILNKLPFIDRDLLAVDTSTESSLTEFFI
jgi:hypothetical protein